MVVRLPLTWGRETLASSLVVAWALFSAAASGATAPTTVAASAPTPSALLSVAADANRFRLAAAAGVHDALNRYGTQQLRTVWEQEVSKAFPEGDLGWQDFFASAVLFVGGLDPDRSAVAAFYNPWHDALVLAWLEKRDAHYLAHDALVVLGSTWRGERQDASLASPAWVKDAEGVTLGLGRAYAATACRFDAEYPPSAPRPFPPARLRLPEKERAAELAALRVRMAQRLAMFQRYVVDAGKAPADGELLRAGARLIRAIARGDGAYLTATGRMARATAAALLELPAEARQRWTPALFSSTKTNALVVVVDTERPLWFALHRLRADANGRLSPAGCEVVSLEALRAALGGAPDRPAAAAPPEPKKGVRP